MSRLTISAVVAIIALGAGFLYLKPEWDALQSMRKERQDLFETNAEFDEIIENRDQLIRSVNAISQADIAKIDSILPTGPRSSQFLITLEHLTKLHGIGLKQIDIVNPSELEADSESSSSLPRQPRPTQSAATSQTVATDEISSLPFQMELVAPYEAIKAFLKELEHNVRLIQINEIGFLAPETAATPLNISITAETYYQ